MKRLLSLAKEIEAAREEGAKVSEILFAVWVEFGAMLFLREGRKS